MTGAGALMLAVFLGPRENLPVLPRPPGDSGVLRIAHPWQLSVDPHIRTHPRPAQDQLLLALWEPLIECDAETGQPRPAAAESWRWSDDRLALTLRLRRDGRWSNGDSVTAQDFVRAWRRLVHQRVDSAAVLFPVKNAQAVHLGELPDSALGVEALDEFTLRIELTSVRSTLVAELADPLFVPFHATTAEVLKSGACAGSPERLVTNGAFRLSRLNHEIVRLAASPAYRERADVRLAGVEFIRADNTTLARMLVAVGRADIAEPSARTEPGLLPTRRAVRIASEMSLGVTSLDLNIQRGPLRDVRVRRALAQAMDRQGFLSEARAERMVPAYSWVPDMPGRPALQIQREDPAAARRLLAEAGYPGGAGFPVLVLPVDPRSENYAYYLAWAERWHRELGIRTYLAFAPLKERRDQLERGEYDVKVSGLVATVPDAGDLLSIFAYPERFGTPEWRNAEVTRLMGEADRRSGQERLVRLEAIERRVLEDVPTIPIMFERRCALLAAEVDGWYPDPLGRQTLRRLALGSADAPLAGTEGNL